MKILLTRKRFFVLVVVLLGVACGPVAMHTEMPEVEVLPNEEIVEETEPEEAGIELGRYFADDAFKESVDALDEDRIRQAVDLWGNIAKLDLDDVLAPRARFVAAYVAWLNGDDVRAVNELPGLATELPLIKDTAYECAARSALRLGNPEGTLELASQIDESSTNAAEATMIIGDALHDLGRFDEALAAFKRYVDNWHSSGRQIEARAKIVRSKTKLVENSPADESTTKDLSLETLDLIDQLRAQSPTSRWVNSLDKQELILLKLLGQKQSRKKAESRAARVTYEKAQGLMRKRRHDKAENTLAKVLRLARKKGNLACRAKYDLALTVSRKRQHERAANLFDKAAQHCKLSEVRVKALYRAGKSFQSVGNWGNAIEHYTQVENDYPAHSYADDARLHGARCQLEKGNKDRFVEMLESLPTIYPIGDMRSEALWSLAHDAISTEDLARAKEVLGRYYSLFPRESGWYTSGRSGYWLARIEELLGDTLNAAIHYEQVVSSAPLSFYMVLAYNRLADMDESHAQQLIADLAPVERKARVEFPPLLLDEHHKLAVGIELFRLGLTTRAKRELDALLGEPDLPPEVYWLSSTLLRRSGRHGEAARASLEATKDWKQRYPVGEDYTQWAMAYPTAYDQEVRKAATINDVMPSMIWAVMREESGFNPRVESWANAIGLMQLILPTAKRVGRKLGIHATRGNLRNPEVNITLGTAYLAHLKKLFEGHPVFMVAGYNAGEGAVARWLRERKTNDLDIFIEEIPYDQTRGYTKRVIATLATYKLLYGEDDRVLTLDLSLSDID